VGDNNQIFGSVQPQEITAYIEKQTARKLDHRNITLPEMKTTGTYEASIKLHPEVTGVFKVQVTRQPN
jgi:large subunit ribosomal protein L9